MRRQVGNVLVAWLLFLAPCASAADAEARLTLTPDARVAGETMVALHSGFLDVSPASPGPLDVRLEFSSAHGRLPEYIWVETPLRGGSDNRDARNATLAWGPGTLSRIVCHERCSIYVFAVPEAPVDLHIDGGLDGALALVEEDDFRHAGMAAAGAENSFRYDLPRGMLRLGPGAWDAPEVAASGQIGLVVANATLEWMTPEGAQTLEVRHSVTKKVVAGVVLEKRTIARHAFLVFDSASLVLAPTRMTSFAPSATLQVEGILAAPAATGWVDFAGVHYDLDGDALEAAGTWTARLNGAGRADSLPFPALVRTPSSTVSLDGDLRRLAIADQEIAMPPASADAVSASALVGVAALLAALAWAMRCLVPLYTRIARAKVLENANRRALHAAIAAVPGRSVADLARATGFAEVVVRHHLGMLLLHRMVREENAGRLRFFYVVDNASTLSAIAMAALRDPTRRRVAEAIAAAPRGLSQLETAAMLGISPRLVSHHLGRLREVGLVATGAALPRRYVATADLARALGAPTALPAGDASGLHSSAG